TGALVGRSHGTPRTRVDFGVYEPRHHRAAGSDLEGRPGARGDRGAPGSVRAVVVDPGHEGGPRDQRGRRRGGRGSPRGRRAGARGGAGCGHGHGRVGRPATIRVNGELLTLDTAPLKPEELKSLAEQIMTPRQVKEFAEHKEADFAIGVPGVGRFRTNVYQQRGTVAFAFRSIPYEVK